MSQQQKAPKLIGTERARLKHEMRRAYEGGLTIMEVAEKFGRSYGNTHMLLHESGVTIRPRRGGFHS